MYAAYGSQKDVAVYQAIDLQPEQIFIVGKASKKTCKEAMVRNKEYFFVFEQWLFYCDWCVEHLSIIFLGHWTLTNECRKYGHMIF